MKRGLYTPGFTIIEVLIVLAVTSALLVSALLMIGGQQQKTQFTQSVNDIQSQVNQIINNVQTGYYTKVSSADFNCTKTAAGPSIDFTKTSTQGTNPDCTFIGRAVQFTNSPSFNVYNLAGLRSIAGTTDDVSTLIEAQPKAITGGDIENNSLQYGMQTFKMYYSVDTTQPSIPTGVVAFVTSLDQVTNGGSTTAKLYAIKNTNLTSGDPSIQINQAGAVNFDANTTSVSICFDGGTNSYSILTIGGNDATLATSVQTIDKSTALGTTCS